TVLTLGFCSALIALGLGFVGRGGLWVSGPGFLPWYFILRTTRQKLVDLTLPVDRIREAVYEPAQRRLALHVSGSLGSLGLSDGWLGIALPPPGLGGDAALSALRTRLGGKLREGAVEKGVRDVALIVGLAVGGVLILAVLASVAVRGASRYAAK